MGAALLDRAGLPSWPHAAISSSPRESRMVQMRPAWMSTDLNSSTCSIVDGLKRVPWKGLNMIRFTCRRRQAANKQFRTG